MAVARKPKKAVSDNQVDVAALIGKGRSVTEEKAEKSEGTAYVQLRMRRDLLAAVDEIMEAKKVPYSRHAWLLEAIQQRIERETA